MENIRELYILGKPITTELGDVNFMKVEHYDIYLPYISYLNIQKFEIINNIRTLDVDIANSLKDVPFIILIKETGKIFELYDMFKELFLLLFNNDVFDQIETDEEFEFYRDLIRKMNAIEKEEKNPNPEIERYNMYSKMYSKQKSNGDISFESVYTSVWMASGIKPTEMTLYELYANFNRIGQFKAFDATTLYSSVTSEAKVESWYKHIEICEDKKQDLTSLEKLKESSHAI